MILEEIVAHTTADLALRKGRLPLAKVQRQAALQPPALSLSLALSGTRLGIIAEVKKASPSAGIIRKDFDATEIARTYKACGADAISVLTD